MVRMVTLNGSKFKPTGYWMKQLNDFESKYFKLKFSNLCLYIITKRGSQENSKLRLPYSACCLFTNYYGFARKKKHGHLLFHSCMPNIQQKYLYYLKHLIDENFGRGQSLPLTNFHLQLPDTILYITLTNYIDEYSRKKKSSKMTHIGLHLEKYEIYPATQEAYRCFQVAFKKLSFMLWFSTIYWTSSNILFTIFVLGEQKLTLVHYKITKATSIIADRVK
ncbi:hypothetical protein ACJX0J_019231 [Zea mays]